MFKENRHSVLGSTLARQYGRITRLSLPLLLLSLVIGHLSYTGCTDNGTESDLVTYSGKVILEGAQDMSGVTVSLYAPVELDTALTRINSEYPGIGVTINQETEFDHREQKALATTTTDASGAWKIEGPRGSYNIVFEKEGWGWKYLLEESSTRVPDVTLSEEQVVPAVVTNDFVFESGKFYRVKEDVSFLGKVTLETAVIVLDKNAEIFFFGNIVSNVSNSNGYTLFTTSDTNNTSRINIHETSDISLNRVKFIHIKKGVYIRNTNTLTMKNSLIRKSNTAIIIVNGVNLNLTNCAVYGSVNGLELTQAGLTLQKNIIYKLYEYGVQVVEGKNTNIKNNVFKKCLKSGIAFNPGGFQTNNTVIRVEANDFRNNRDHLFIGYKTSGNANNNNFFAFDNFAVECKNTFKIDTLNFTNNYWNTRSNVDIVNSIKDVTDFEQGSVIYPYIEFDPYLIQKYVW